MHEDTTPLAPITDGRDHLGRFAPGNPGGQGNPLAKEHARVRRLIRESVTDADLVAIVAVLVAEAKAGNIVAIRELLDRLAGKPRPIEDDPPDPAAVCIHLEFDQGG
ncbi:MAG: hypothetical protein KIT54_02455 [Phycisphaeraceae bacterium]|nr:hypothetical protein [Phycisphaeraceae bacterium]